jgi:hypothetical protein
VHERRTPSRTMTRAERPLSLEDAAVDLAPLGRLGCAQPQPDEFDASAVPVVAAADPAWPNRKCRLDLRSLVPCTRELS